MASQFATFGTRVGALLFRARINTLMGYPAAGVHVGGGTHVDMPDTWDGTGAVPPGWTRQHAHVLKHPTLSQWAHLVDAAIIQALADARAQRLSAAERTAVQTQVSAAAALDATWDTATEDDP